jgi:hypothetical protein
VTLQLTSGLGRLIAKFSRSHTPIMTPLGERSARRRGRYLHNTQQTLQTNIHALTGILTHDLRKQAPLDPMATVVGCLLT